MPDLVAGLLQNVGVDRPLGGEDAEVTHRLLELPGVAAGQEAGPAGAALGIVREGVGKQDSLPRHAVKGRGIDPFAAISAGVAKRPIVGDDEQDVRAFCVRGARLDRGSRGEQQAAQSQKKQVLARLGSAHQSDLRGGKHVCPNAARAHNRSLTHGRRSGEMVDDSTKAPPPRQVQVSR